MGLRKARRETHELVASTGNKYAYQFVRVGKRLVEVRALANGATQYTHVDKSGKPIGKSYGAPSLKRIDARLAVAAVATVGFALELVL